ncbi:MAG: cyclic pyranopterin monophosphate synthase MoaC [Rhodopseudomonas sp.]|nr:cyclic pyranopterin monophosphate synthase MoaC [Rhodopseudomonas sp.]
MARKPVKKAKAARRAPKVKGKVKAKPKASVSGAALGKNAVKRSKARPAAKPKLSHIDRRGQAHMVDVSAKAQTERVAVAEGKVIMRTDTLDMVIEGNALKGDVLGAARLAGILAAKRTHGLIPLCHPLPITKVEIDINPEHTLPGFLVQATVKVTGQTGVEMEALTAVSIACLTIYDMVKAVERGMRIEGIRVLEKSGGKSGHYKAEF